MRSASGTPKASVLPEPVGDWASTSRPARTSAMTSFWIAKGSRSPRRARAVHTAPETPRSAKDCDDIGVLLLAPVRTPWCGRGFDRPARPSTETRILAGDGAARTSTVAVRCGRAIEPADGTAWESNPPGAGDAAPQTVLKTAWATAPRPLH